MPLGIPFRHVLPGARVQELWTPKKFLESQHDDIWKCVSKMKRPLKCYFINILE